MKKEKDKRAFLQKNLYSYHFLNDGITFILPTLMASFFILFQLTWFQMGLIFALNSLTTIIFQLIIGYYTDKEKLPKILMLIGLFLLAFSSFLMIFSFDFLSLLVFAVISGIALAFQHSISYATTSRMYKENRDIKIGHQGAAGDLGKCVAVFSSALIILVFASWQLVLLMWSILALISFLVISFNLRKIKFESFYIDFELINNKTDNSTKKPQKIIIYIILTIFTLHLAVYSLLITNLATYLRIEKTGNVSKFSILILGYTLIFGIFGAYLSGMIKKKYGMINSVLLCSSLLIILLTTYLFLDSSDLIITLIFYALIGFFLFLMYPQLLAAVNDIFHSKKIGFGYGLVLCLGWFGSLLGSLIGGYYADIYSGNVFIVLSIIWLIINIILAIFIKTKHEI